MLLIAAGGATTLALGLAPGPIPLLVVRVVAAGRVRGNLTLLQATAVTDRWGVTRYGSLRPTGCTCDRRRSQRALGGCEPRRDLGRLPAHVHRALRRVPCGCEPGCRRLRKRLAFVPDVRTVAPAACVSFAPVAPTAPVTHKGKWSGFSHAGR
ncbi:hypothetical protein STAN_5696 [Streptomyces sp. CBMAI 2042]|nr:hypothetical protein STAN_5696 [Streptomyces sp. CBMAI 2042]